MVVQRRGQYLRERIRGVGFVVGLGLLVCLVGLSVTALMTWLMT